MARRSLLKKVSRSAAVPARDFSAAGPPAVLGFVQFALFSKNPSHPSLRFKQVGPFWSVRVSHSYRALAVKNGDELTWFWIGTHADYDKFLA